MAPLFVLWAIRGTDLLPDWAFILLCTLMAVLPTGVLGLRVRVAMDQQDRREITVGYAEDHRDHILIYLFVMLLPLYAIDIGTWRNLGASLAALGFIAFLFWHLNLHYMNLVFAVLGYRVFTVHPPADGNQITGKANLALITRRVILPTGERLVAYRISDTVYLEAGS